MEKLAGKVALVTGGASGIGLGMVNAFLREGMRVIIADISDEHIAAAETAFTQSGASDNVLIRKLDVSDRAAYADLVRLAEERFGPVQLLCNNAGMGVGRRLADTTFEDWDWGMSVMIGGTVNGILTVLPGMIAAGEGHIVNTSSMAAIHPPAMKGGQIYCTAKAALIGLTEQSKLDLADHNIGVSVLCPGPVRTNIFKGALTRPERYKRDPRYTEPDPAALARPVDPRWMDPDEVGQMVVDGVRANRLYILTHGMFRDGARERFDRIIEAFPSTPDDPSLIADLAIHLHNPIFAPPAGA